MPNNLPNGDPPSGSSSPYSVTTSTNQPTAWVITTSSPGSDTVPSILNSPVYSIPEDFDGWQLMIQQRDELTGRRRRPANPIGLFTPRDGIETLIRIRAYLGKINRNFGRVSAIRFRFRILMWDGTRWSDPLLWDVSTTVFKDLVEVLAADGIASYQACNTNIRITRRGSGLRTQYELIIHPGPEAGFAPRGLHNATMGPSSPRVAPPPSGDRLSVCSRLSPSGAMSWRPMPQQQGPSLEEEFFDRNPSEEEDPEVERPGPDSNVPF